MIRAQGKGYAANVLPTTLGQGNFLGAASTKKGRRRMTAPSSTSLAWLSRAQFKNHFRPVLNKECNQQKLTLDKKE
jgi:hypothetical protein